MKFQTDYAVIKFDKLFENESEIEGPNKKRILYALAEEPDKYVRNYGEVISVPGRLSNQVWGLNRVGLPMYRESSPNELIFLNEIPMSVEVGDRAYVHHLSVMNALKGNGHLLKEEKNEKGETEFYMKVLMSEIFCSIRGGEIVANATWTVVEPIMETWDEILRPLPELDSNGSPVFENKINRKTGLFEKQLKLKPKKEWLQIKVRPEARLLEGKIIAVGPTQDGETQDLFIGDKILYRNNADFEVKVEGKKYYMIRHRHIEAVMN